MRDASILLSDLVERYARMQLVGRSGQGKLLIHIAVKWLNEFLGRPARASDFSDETITDFAAWRLEQGIAIATVQNNQLKLLALWRWSNRMGIVRTAPTIKAVSVPERIPRAWTKDELAQLFAAISETDGLIAGVPANLWWEVLHRLLWDTGERKEAILATNWSNVDLAGRVLMVPAELRKGRTRDKCYRLGEDTVAALEKLPRRAGPVLPWQKCPDSIYPAYREILKRADLPHDRHSLFHRMRRSVASHIKAAGGDATAAMDHSSSRTTDGYLDPRIVPTVNPSDLLFRLG